MEKVWLVSVWDGNSSNYYEMKGTYDYVSNYCRRFPAGYIWSVS